jgi:hypothetical protein
MQLYLHICTFNWCPGQLFTEHEAIKILMRNSENIHLSIEH